MSVEKISKTSQLVSLVRLTTSADFQQPRGACRDSAGTLDCRAASGGQVMET